MQWIICVYKWKLIRKKWHRYMYICVWFTNVWFIFSMLVQNSKKPSKLQKSKHFNHGRRVQRGEGASRVLGVNQNHLVIDRSMAQRTILFHGHVLFVSPMLTCRTGPGRIQIHKRSASYNTYGKSSLATWTYTHPVCKKNT